MRTDGDYISREAAIRIASGYCHPANIAEELSKLPAADVRPVVRGKWTSTGAGHLTSKCSVCGYKSLEAGNFCPNCGADMREEN